MATLTTSKPGEKPKKEPAPAGKRIQDQLKRAAVGGKLTKTELESISELAKSLMVFTG